MLPPLDTVVTIGGSYHKPEIVKQGQPARVPSLICSDGVTDQKKGCFTVGGTQGLVPPGLYKFAIVKSLNASEPITENDYVIAKQDNGTFCGLAAGTYYVRIYDASCSGVNYSTDTIMIPSFTLSPKPITEVDIHMQDCSTLNLFVSFVPLSVGNGYHLPSPPYPADTVIVTWNNGTNDTITQFNYYGGGFLKDTAVLGGFPITATVTYKNACGEIFTQTKTINRPSISFAWTDPANHNKGNSIPGYTTKNCDSVNVPNHPRMIDDNNGSYSHYYANDALISCYSLDSGKTWIPYKRDSVFALPKNDTIRVLYQLCNCGSGDAAINTSLPFILITPGNVKFAVNIAETNWASCEGNSGIGFAIHSNSVNGDPTKIKMTMTDAPDAYKTQPGNIVGQELSMGVAARNYMNNNGATYYPELMNLPLGKYKFSFTDDCGDIYKDSVTLTKPYSDTPQYTPVIACHPEDSYVSASFAHAPVYYPSGTIKNGDGQWDLLGVFLEIYTKQPDGTWKDSLTIQQLGTPMTILKGAAANDYKIVTYRVINLYTPSIFDSNNSTGKQQYSTSTNGIPPPGRKSSEGTSFSINFYADCQEDTIITFNPAMQPLTAGTKVTASCNDNTMSAVGQAQNGVPPYTYSVWTTPDGVNLGTKVQGYQSSPVFNGLDKNITYLLEVSDMCGSGVTPKILRTSYTPVFDQTNYLPCLGSNLSISVFKDPALSYNWYYLDTTNASNPADRNITQDITGGGSLTLKNVSIVSDTALLINDVQFADNGGKYTLEITMSGVSCPLFRKTYDVSAIACTLPLHLTSFTGTKTSGGNYLKWTTANEVNTSNFSIEYGKNSRSLTTIASVPASGNTESANYSYLHAGVQGDAYYRLKMIDKDGKYYYSPVISMQGTNPCTGNQFSIKQVAPTPFTSSINVSYCSGDDMNVTAQIWNQQGQLVVNQTAQLKKGIDEYFTINNLESLANGIYILKIQNATGIQQTIKLVKLK